MFGSWGVLLVLLLLLVGVPAVDCEEIGVGVSALYQVACVVCQDELCEAHVYPAGVCGCCELSGDPVDAAFDSFDRGAG